MAGKTGIEPAYSNYSFNVRLEGGGDTFPLKIVYFVFF